MHKSFFHFDMVYIICIYATAQNETINTYLQIFWFERF